MNTHVVIPSRFKVAIALTCLAFLATSLHAADRHAYHVDCHLIRHTESAGGNTTYTPSLDLTPLLVNCLQYSALDEVFLKITFRAGVTPSLNRLVDIRYGSELVLTPAAGLYSRVVGQDLLVWTGLQHRSDFGETILFSDSEWTFTMTGDDPVAGVYAFVSYHSLVTEDMPDLLPMDAPNLCLLPEQLSALYAEGTDGYVQGKLSFSAQKLIVLVHGWNPAGYTDCYAPDDDDELGPRWADLCSALAANSIVQRGGWTIARYDWHRDAATGGRTAAVEANAKAARDAASAHGAKLAKMVERTGATQVQFIAHSAGNWAARRAAAYLKLKHPGIQIQITALDPFVVDDLQPAFELTDLWTNYRDNFYVVDAWTDAGADFGGLHWTSGDFARWNNQDLEYLGTAGLYETWMDDHSGPVAWYALTAQEPNLRNSDLFLRDAGFLASLPVRLASAANDNFPGETLTGASGSTFWVNYQATAQPGEPDHGIISPARHSVWGRWIAPASGSVTFDTFGGDFLNLLAAYTGNSVSTLTLVTRGSTSDAGPGQVQITFDAVAGQVYYIAMDGFFGDAGQAPLHWQMSGTGTGTTPTVALNAPAAGATLSGVTTVTATANGATKVEFYLDGVLRFTDAAAPYAWAWDTTAAANGSHTLLAKSYSGSAPLATSASREVTVSNSSPPPGDCPDAYEPNNSSPIATPLPPGASLTSFICSPTDVDWFQTTVTNAGTLAFNVTVPAGLDYELEVYGPDYRYVQGSYQPPGQPESVTLAVPGPGTYYARIYGYPVGHGCFSTSAGYTVAATFNGWNGNQSGGVVVAWGSEVIPFVEPGTRYSSIAAARDHSLALKSDGTVVAWGGNWNGQCTVPSSLSGVVAISAGDYHSLALKSNGTVVAWGGNGNGQCTVPSGLSGVVAISAGVYHSLALKSDGTVVAWGDNGSAQFAVPSGLSDAVAISAGGAHNLALKSDGTVVAWGGNWNGQCTVPSSLSGVVAISAGGGHSLALKSDGTVVTWGDNTYGQCNVSSGLSGVVAIAAGSHHSMALKSDGTAVAWGDNYSGQCTVPSGLSGVVAIAAGSYHSLALKSDGTIAAWGGAFAGQPNPPGSLSSVIAIAAIQLMVGNRPPHVLALKSDGTVVSWGYNDFGQCTVPSGLSGVVSISAGGLHSLALKSDGIVVAWGDNGSGQCTVPSGLSGAVAISAGVWYSMALKSDGTVVAWGDNYSGQCTVPSGLSGAVAIAAGGGHSLALKSDGTVVAWGDNTYGQCTVPSGLSGVVAISAGDLHSLALKSDGTVVAWGDNTYGQCNVSSGLSGVVAVAARVIHSLALKSNGTVVGWGYNEYGQCTLPDGLRGVTAIAAGGSCSLAIVNPNLAGVPPRIVSSVEAKSVPQGASVSFSASVLGTSPCSYQWRRNGVNLPGANATTLTLANAQPADAGEYSLSVVNAYGSTTGAIATLAVITPPPPVISSPRWSSGQFWFSFPSTPGQTYVVEYKEDLRLPGAAWIPLQSFTGDGSLKSFTNQPPAGPQRFYRLRQN